MIAPADSALQAHFQGRPAVLRQFATAECSTFKPRVVYFPLPRDAAYEARYRAFWGRTTRDFAQQGDSLVSSQVFYRAGEAGTPRPYSLRDDDMILGTLLLSIFLMMWIVFSSWSFLRDAFKDFFRQRTRANLFTDRQDTMLRGRGYTLLQTSFLQSILYFEYVRHFLPELFERLSPYVLLANHLLVLLAYYLLKILLYKWVNATFFAPEPRRQWGNHWFISVLSMGTALVPLTLLVVFFALPPEAMILSYVLLMMLIKSLLFYKTKRIFFDSLIGILHIILYFCALEVVPLLGLWIALEASTHWLATLL